MAYFTEADENPFSFDAQPATAPPIAPLPTPSFQAAWAPTPEPTSPSFEGLTAPQPDATGDDFSYGSAAPAPAAAAPAQTLSAMGAGSQPGASPSTPSASGTPDFQSMMQAVQNATDPTQRAVAQDALSRSLYANFKDAGHDVKWQGDNLIVDGRAYVVGGGGIATSAGTDLGQVRGDDPRVIEWHRNNPFPDGGSAEQQQEWMRQAQAIEQQYPRSAPGTSASAGTVGQYGLPAGAVPEKFNDLSYHSPKYDLLRTVSQYPPTTEGMRQAVAAANAQGGHYQIVGDDRVIDTSNGDSIDLIQDVGGPNARWWFGSELEYANAHPGETATGSTPSALAPLIARQAGGASATPVNLPSGPAPVGGWAPAARSYAPGDVPMDDLPSHSFEDLLARMQNPDPAQVETQYDAGQVSNDPLNLGRVEDDFHAGRVSNDPLDTYTFKGFGDLGRLGGGPVDPATEALILRQVGTPESLDARTIDTLKARNKDELADQQALEEENLRAMGGQLGIDDSPWLASERLASKRGRDLAVVKGNRDIDIEAARTNAADRRAAAELGMSYASSKAGRNLAERQQRFVEANTAEGLSKDSVESKNAAAAFKRAGELTNEQLRQEATRLRQTGQQANAALLEKAAAFRREGELANEQLRGQAFDRRTAATQANIDNAFKSAADKRSAIALASDTTLKAAAAKGDRIALREAIKQKATELGQSADKIRLDYTLGLIDDATRRYGIDVGASIDRAKLAQAGQQFQEDLAFRIAALAQADRQFGAQYGIDLGRYQRDLDNDAWARYNDSMSYE